MLSRYTPGSAPFAAQAGAVKVDARQSAPGRPGGRFAVTAAAVAAALASEMAHADGAVHVDVVTDLADVGPVHMTIHRYALAHLAAEKVINRHVCHFALDVPERHVHAGDGVVDDGAGAPVGVLVHELPELADAADIAPDQQRLEIGLDQVLHRKMAIGEGCTAQAE